MNMESPTESVEGRLQENLRQSGDNNTNKDITQQLQQLETSEGSHLQKPRIPVENSELYKTNEFCSAENRQHLHLDLPVKLQSDDILDDEVSPELPTQVLPSVNCQEKIVICIDISSEMEKEQFKARAGACYSGMEILKKALKLFISNKDLAGSVVGRHQFALVVLLDQALWVKDFTSNVTELFKHLDELDCLQESYDKFDMCTLFDLILEKAQPPILANTQKDVPPFIVRVLLIYSRSHCRPYYSSHESRNLITGSPCFFIDVLYLHEPPSSSNLCEEIYAELCYLDEKGFCHVYEASKAPTKVFDAMAKLLAHPLQRALQIQSGYKLDPAPLPKVIDEDDVPT